ncbi:hypothetical protein Tco_1364461, partial [Tanacetum coccineum]
MMTQKPKKPKKNNEVPQPSGSTKHVADKAINEEMDDSLVRAATTASSLEAKQDSVKKLENKRGSRTHRLKRLYKVGSSERVISSDEASLGDQEDASKQGRKIDDICKNNDLSKLVKLLALTYVSVA